MFFPCHCFFSCRFYVDARRARKVQQLISGPSDTLAHCSSLVTSPCLPTYQHLPDSQTVPYMQQWYTLRVSGILRQQEIKKSKRDQKAKPAPYQSQALARRHSARRHTSTHPWTHRAENDQHLRLLVAHGANDTAIVASACTISHEPTVRVSHRKETHHQNWARLRPTPCSVFPPE